MFENKNIIIWGAGKEGLAIYDFLSKNNIKADIVEGETINFQNIDIIFKSPGVSFYNPCIQEAIKQGVQILSGTNLFMMNLPPETKTIAITGTKGKSTTSSLLAHVLKSKGLSVGYGGNIGTPLVRMIGEAFDYFVAELSSYQCTDLIYPFDISVVVNLYPEHIDWHRTHERYYEDKLNLLRIRHSRQVAFVNFLNAETVNRTKCYPDLYYFNHPQSIHLEDGYFMDGKTALFSCNKITNLKGEHNLENICAVLSVLKRLNIDLAGIEETIISFDPLPHRLQTLCTIKGVQFIDDSISTTPQTSLAGLKAFNTVPHIYLLVGGYDRQQDYTPLLSYVEKHKEKITLLTLPLTGKRVYQQAKEQGIDALSFENIALATAYAQEKASSGDVVLLSPGAPSYHAYKNFEARGDDFKNHIKK